MDPAADDVYGRIWGPDRYQGLRVPIDEAKDQAPSQSYFITLEPRLACDNRIRLNE